MMNSMTGFGRAESVFNNKKLVIEVKSLNHRNLEIIARLPFAFSSLEVDVKKRISERISRGRVEISARVDAEPAVGEEINLILNLPLVRNYYSLLMRIKQEFALEDDITLTMLANCKNGIYAAEMEADAENLSREIMKVIDKALESLVEMKRREGDLLYDDFRERLFLIETYIEALEVRAPQTVIEYKKRLSERIRELTEGVDSDESRLMQEVAIMAEKSDITEEIVRFASHIKQFRDMMNAADPVGRKMDFLLQEMHREINTIGSKSNDLEISDKVIEIKTELAKLREQTQNIE